MTRAEAIALIATQLRTHELLESVKHAANRDEDTQLPWKRVEDYFDQANLILLEANGYVIQQESFLKKQR